MRFKQADHRTTYYLGPGQTLQNTRIQDRTLALVIPNSTYARFKGYALEAKKVSLNAEREMKRLADLKQATYEMSKSWQDKPLNIQKRKREELLSRRSKEEAARIAFAKEMSAKKAIERAEVVKQARELLVYRRPAVRSINRALLVSDCLRELEAQSKFKGELDKIHVQLEEQYAKSVLEDVEKFKEEEAQKKESIAVNRAKNTEELLKQIGSRKREADMIREATRKAEIEENEAITKELESVKEQEMERERKKKEELNKIFLEDMEGKREYELKRQEKEEFQNKTLQLYRDFKDLTKKLTKEKEIVAKQKKLLKTEMLSKQLSKVKEASLRKAARDEKKAEEIAKEREEQERLERGHEAMRRRKAQAQQALHQGLARLHEEKRHRAQEERDLLLWESMQRVRRHEANVQWEAERQQELRDKKAEYAEQLKAQMAERQSTRERERILEDEGPANALMVRKANEVVLSYGEKVLQESEGVRPLYPIAKTLLAFKKEAGLLPYSNKEANCEAPAPVKRKTRGRRAICPPCASVELALS